MQAPSAKKRKAPNRDPKDYDAEYQALQASLEDYLQKQVSLLSSPAGSAAAETRREGGLLRYRADLYFVVTLALIGFLWWQSPGRSPAPQDPPVTAGTPPAAGSRGGDSVPSGGSRGGDSVSPPPGTAAAPALAEPPPEMKDPSAWWSGYVEGHRTRVADWLVAVSQAKGLEASQVSDRQKQNFKGWAAKVGAGNASSSELTSCRIGLFELIYGRWIQDAGNVAVTSQWEKVDLVVNPAEYAAQDVSRLLAELGRGHWFDNGDPTDAKLQIAVVLAWLETHQP